MVRNVADRATKCPFVGATVFLPQTTLIIGLPFLKRNRMIELKIGVKMVVSPWVTFYTNDAGRCKICLLGAGWRLQCRGRPD